MQLKTVTVFIFVFTEVLTIKTLSSKRNIKADEKVSRSAAKSDEYPSASQSASPSPSQSPVANPGDPSNPEHKENANPTAQECAKPPACPTTQPQYRTTDGSCNNKLQPNWGRSKVPVCRFLPPNCSDAKRRFQNSQDGSELPNSISACDKLSPSNEVQSVNLTLLVMTWGQVVAHDTLSLVNALNALACCPNTEVTDQCCAMAVPKNNAMYPKEKCENVVRSNTTNGCPVTEQINHVTSFLDCSIVYGSDDKTAKELRLFKDGLLRSQIVDEREFLPIAKSFDACDKETKKACYFAGDVRVNQNPWITTMQTIFLRLHNEIARKLKKLNPHWNEEKLFQEARRIVIAINQKITYCDWLPYIVGQKAMDEWNLCPARKGYSYDYDPSVNSATCNEFTIVFRILHYLIPGLVKLMGKPKQTEKEMPLGQNMNRSEFIQMPPENFKKTIIPLYSQSCHEANGHDTKQITQYLFRLGNLCALDDQRTKDHCIAKYCQFLEKYDGSKTESMKDFSKINAKNQEKLKRVYKFASDVSLFFGTLLEDRVKGALIGPTALRIFLEQFFRWKWGDIYFYDHGKSPYPFTLPQLDAIRNVTLPTVLCLIEKDLGQITRNVWVKESSANPLVDCSQIPELDLTPFKETGNKNPK